MSTQSKLIGYALARCHRSLLWGAYQFSPNLYWSLRSRELHERWFSHDSDYHVYREFIYSLSARSCLEIGCSGGRFSRHLVMDVETLECQDISAKAIALCRENVAADTPHKVTFSCGEIARLYSDYPADSFDVVVSNRVLSAVKSGDIAMTIVVLARIARHVVINELMPGDRGGTYYWFAHDYDRLFADVSLLFVREVLSNNERYRLYSKTRD